jgi:uncharacterized protein YjbI with pentapeptide repeats
MLRLARLAIGVAAFVPAPRVQADDFVFSHDFDNLVGELVGSSPTVGGDWSQTGTQGANPIQTSGSEAYLSGFGQDAYSGFTSSITNTTGRGMITSLELNLNAASGDGDYFLHLSDPLGTTFNFYQRLFARASANGFQLGLRDTSGTGSATTWGELELNYGETYHVDVQWTFVPGDTNDQFTVTLDHSTYLTHAWTSETAEPAQLAAVNLRQGTAANGPSLWLDNLEVVPVAVPLPQFNIYKWEYVAPSNPSLGKQPTASLARGGYGLHAQPGLQASGRNLANAFLVGADLANASFSSAILTRAALEHSNLTNADLNGANLTGASIHEANLNDSSIRYAKLSSTKITLNQLYSTASYKNRDLTGVQFVGNDLSGANLADQSLASASFYAAKLVGADLTNADLTGGELDNADLSQANLSGANFTNASLVNANLGQAILTNANFNGANLIGTNLTGADVRGAGLGGATTYVYGYICGKPSVGGCLYYTYGVVGTQIGGGVNLAQLSTTASFQAHDLRGIDFSSTNLAGAIFAGFNLTNANFTNATLTGADLSGADARGASGLDGFAAPNLIRPDGHIVGLTLGAGESLDIRDYDGGASGNIPITVDEQLTMVSGATLRLVLEADAWNSTISFAPGIPVTLSGNLQLALADGIEPTSQIGRTFHIFNWSGVTPNGAFSVLSYDDWDLESLYITGEVTLLAASGAENAAIPNVPEPAALLLLSAGIVFAGMMRRPRPNATFVMGSASMCRFVTIVAMLVAICGESLAVPPAIELNVVGAPVWKPVDFQLFSAPATPFDQEFGQVYDTLLPFDSPLAGDYVPHAPPYDTELSAGMIAGGYVSQSVFAPDAITLQPNGVYFAYQMVPDPGTTGSSRDFELGPIIPNSFFPIATNVDVWLDGVLVDRTPGADALIPVQPRDAVFQGTSHLEYVFVIWHPWDDDLTVGPLGNYDLRMSIRDVGGSGWDVHVPFRVAMPGDYDYSGTVGPEDYDVWRANYGSAEHLAADGNGDGQVNAADYTVWRNNLGTTLASGNGTSNTTVPEPATLSTLLFGVLLVVSSRRAPCRRLVRQRNAQN